MCSIVLRDCLGHKLVSVDPDYFACVPVEGEDGAAQLVGLVLASLHFTSELAELGASLGARDVLSLGARTLTMRSSGITRPSIRTLLFAATGDFQ